MSDPVTNVEVEDVLSSIRRLVSQEGGEPPAGLAHSDAKNVAAEGEETPSASDALVLTENHRVDLEDDELAPESTPMEEARREAASAVRSELERAIEELEAAMGIAEQKLPNVGKSTAAEPEPEEVSDSVELDDASAELDWEAPVGRAMEGVPPGFDAEEVTSEADEPHADASEVAEDHSEQDYASEDAEAHEPEEIEGEAIDEQLDEHAEDTPFEFRQESNEAAEIDDTLDAEQDMEGAHVQGADRTWDTDTADPEPEPKELPTEDAQIDQHSAHSAHSEHSDDVAPEDEDGAEEEAVAAVFRHNAVERLHLVSEEYDSDEDTFSGPYEETYETEGQLDHIPARVEAALADQADNFEAPQPPFDDTKDDPFPGHQVDDTDEPVVALDEEQLRDMVAEIVREELQGELGERITRNVRKLVRREINRALAGQDLI